MLRAGIPIVTPCGDGLGADPPFRVVAGTVPLPKETANARFLLGDALLEDYRLPKGEPNTELALLPGNGQQGVADIGWKSDHPDGAPLTHLLGFSSDDGATAAYAADRRHDREDRPRPSPRVPRGERCRFCVTTTDGAHTVAAVSEPIGLPVKPCLTMIFEPAPEARLAAGTPLRLSGQGYWREERGPEHDQLYWSSSLQGALGRGLRGNAAGGEARNPHVAHTLHVHVVAATARSQAAFAPDLARLFGDRFLMARIVEFLAKRRRQGLRVDRRGKCFRVSCVAPISFCW